MILEWGEREKRGGGKRYYEVPPDEDEKLVRLLPLLTPEPVDNRDGDGFSLVTSCEY